GRWVLAAETAGGIQVPDGKLKGRKFEVKGNKYFAESPATGGEKGTFTVDPTKTPRTLDSTASEGVNKGKPRLAIYEIDGDTLKVCYTPFGGPRPKAFVSPPNTDTILATYKRARR